MITTLSTEGFRGVVRDDGIARALYSEAAGVSRIVPVAVAVPRDTDDIVRLVKWARETGHALVPRGSGSSMAAGAIGAHVVVDVSRMDQVQSVDIGRRRVIVGPGAIRNAVNGLARVHGLRLPVDPSSGAFCTIGGMTATNAAGARTLLHGAMREWVMGIECVFDDGSVAWVRRGEPLPLHVPAVARLAALLEDLSRENAGEGRALLSHAVRKESSGYAVRRALSNGGHLVDVLVGSEGTLAIFSAIELALAALPAASTTILSMYDSLDAAADVAMQVAATGASACELLDRTYLDIAAPSGVPRGTEAVLIIEVEHATEGVDEAFAQVSAVCRSGGATELVTARDATTEAELWALRHSASPVLAQLPPSTKSMQFIEDGCVPPEHFARYVRGVRDALTRAETTGAIFGHAGDAHAHVNPLIDMRHSSWRDRVYRLFDEVCTLTAHLGGTLAGEHGDGRLRTAMLSRTWSNEALAAFARVKRAADPQGIFNPGCKVAADGETAGIGEIRYDRNSGGVPDIVRAALDRMEKDRAWHKFRLSLVE